MRRLLLVSNSTLYGSGYLDHCEREMKALLGGVSEVLFVPYAQPGGMRREDYTSKARERLGKMGYGVKGMNEGDPRKLVEEADAMFIGGGNTFILLNGLRVAGNMGMIQERVKGGMPYVGASAGSVVACPTIMTTNDMPIEENYPFTALNLVPFQINPHFLDDRSDDVNGIVARLLEGGAVSPEEAGVLASRHMGETREERIMEYHSRNGLPVVGLREGSMLRVDGGSMVLRGSSSARLFLKGEEPAEYAPGADLSFLLE